MALTLAIDLGTTNLKVGLVNEQGEILSLYSAAIRTISNEAGQAEHDPEELKNLLLQSCKKVLQDHDKSEVRYIISSTYHFGMMILDEKRKPVTGITLLTDIRSQFTFSDFVMEYSGDDVYNKTGCPLISQYVLPRLYYFSKKNPELFKKGKYFHDSKSFLFEWLTGEWITDISTSSATQLFNIHNFQWDQEILSKLNLSSEQFPKPADGRTVIMPLKKEICETLGLQNDTKVVLGVYDGAVLGYGLSALRQGVGIINIGTTAMLRVPGQQPVFDKNDNKRIQAYAISQNIFLNGGALNNAALPLDWMRNNFFDFDPQDKSLLDISSEPPLISLPYLTGERDSKSGPHASGVFFGIRRSHSKIDFVRSVLEGVAYSMRYIYEALEENSLHINEIRMGGGGINIKAWPQIFADVLGIPVETALINEIALVGNAILAFAAGGIFKDVIEASNNMVRQGNIIEPNKEISRIRQRHYEFYKKLRETLAPFYKEHAALRT